MKGDYIRGNVDTIILKCLGSGELYGGEIAKLVKTATDGTFELKKPTLYSALKRLEKDRLVSVRDENSPIGGTRHYYSLTEDGRSFLTNKKFDWVYSKLLIDNLVLDKKIIEKESENDAEKTIVMAPAASVTQINPDAAVASTQTVAAQTVEIFIDKNNEVVPAAAVASKTNVATITATTREIDPVEEYTARNGTYITVPLVKPRQIAVDISKVDTQRTAAAKKLAFGLNSAINTPIGKITALPEAAPKEIQEKSLLKGFIKHGAEKKSGKFVFYNRLRLVVATVVSLCVLGGMALAYAYLKTPATYTTSEFNFYLVGAVGVGVYLLANAANFIIYPKYKQVVNGKTQGLVRRAILSVCICISALSVCLIAGLSDANASNFLVYWIVPCIVGSLFILEGIGIHMLRRVSFFLT